MDTFDASLKHPDFYELFSNLPEWHRKYIHENYSDNLLADTKIAQPCPDVYWFPLVSTVYCQHLIGEWRSVSVTVFNIVSFCRNNGKLWRMVEWTELCKLKLKEYLVKLNVLNSAGPQTGWWIWECANSRYSHETSWPWATLASLPQTVRHAHPREGVHWLQSRCNYAAFLINIQTIHFIFLHVATKSNNELCGSLPPERAGLATSAPRCIHIHHQHCTESRQRGLWRGWLPVFALQLLSDQSAARMVTHSPGEIDALSRGIGSDQRSSLHHGLVRRSMNAY